MDNDKQMQKQEAAVTEAVGEMEVDRLEFYGGAFTSTLPLVFFIIWAIVLSVLKLVTEEALVLGMVWGLHLAYSL
jgi:hypothetical protein